MGCIINEVKLSGVAGPSAAWCGGQICRPIEFWKMGSLFKDSRIA